MAKMLFIIRCCLVSMFMVMLLEGLAVDLKEKCAVVTISGRPSVFCDGETWKDSEKVLTLDDKSTKNIYDIYLENFKIVKYYSPLQVNRLNIKHVEIITVMLNSESVKNVSDGDTHKNEQEYTGSTGKIEISLTDIRKLNFENENNGTIWNVGGLFIEYVEIIDFNLNDITIYAANLDISYSKILIHHELTTIITDSVLIVTHSTLEFLSRGCWNATSVDIKIFYSKINLNNGKFDFFNTSRVEFIENKIYSFHQYSVHTDGSVRPYFFNNEFFNINSHTFEDLSNTNLSIFGNYFDCRSCEIKNILLNSNLGQIEYVNFCLSNCSLSLSRVKYYMNNSCLCSAGEHEADDNYLCSLSEENLQTCGQAHVTFSTVVRWTVCILIPLILMIALIYCICQRENRRMVREIAMSKVLPHKLECERQTPESLTEISLHVNPQTNRHSLTQPDDSSTDMAGSCSCK